MSWIGFPPTPQITRPVCCTHTPTAKVHPLNTGDAAVITISLAAFLIPWLRAFYSLWHFFLQASWCLWFLCYVLQKSQWFDTDSVKSAAAVNPQFWQLTTFELLPITDKIHVWKKRQFTTQTLSVLIGQYCSLTDMREPNIKGPDCGNALTLLSDNRCSSIQSKSKSFQPSIVPWHTWEAACQAPIKLWQEWLSDETVTWCIAH